MGKYLRIVATLGALFCLVLLALKAKPDEESSIQSKESHARKLWETSGHADSSAEAFTHWNEEGEIPPTCAKCHSTPGFRDFLGVDGSTPEKVDSSAKTGTTIECEACHSDYKSGLTHERSAVTFPSGKTVENLGPEALCIECHQGRASTNSVNEAIARASVEEDVVSQALGFINIHYYAAAVTQFGTFVRGGYEYSGKSYDSRFSHLTGYNACTTCHNPHSLKIDINSCNTCHTGIKDPKDIRFYGSFVDYDGDGDMVEGIYYEIEDLKERLYLGIKKYAREIVLNPIVYDSHTYPYFFNDLNDNGQADENEINFANRYITFTPRLLKAAYNYQVAQKDPNSYAHGGKYIIELLFDSLEDLNRKLEDSHLLAGIYREDEGHFNGSAEAWRHWDEEGKVPASCSKCHSSQGLSSFLEQGKTVSEEPSNGLLCITCHTTPPGMRKAGAVRFPSGISKDMGDSSNLCLNCHQGRASKFTVKETISSSPGPYSFINIHYYPAAAVLFGSEVKAGFEFPNRNYATRTPFLSHQGKFQTCVECHMGTKSENAPYDITGHLHNVQSPDPADCVFCHGNDISQPQKGTDPRKFHFRGIRPATIPDYDGDGDISESIREELKGLEKLLYAEIRKYALEVLKAALVYDGHTYPYFFYDLNANGKVDPGENIYPNGYNSFDPALLKAAYNFQLSKKEPGGYIHNSRYIAQLLVDSIEHLGGKRQRFEWR